MAKTVPYCADFRTVELARDLVGRFIDPALTVGTEGATWSPQQLTWVPAQH